MLGHGAISQYAISETSPAAGSGAISATCSASSGSSASLTGKGALAATVASTSSQTATIGGGLGSIRGDASGDNITYSTTAPSGSSHSVIFFARPRADRNTYSCPMSIDAGTTDYVYAETEVDGLVMKMWDDSGGSITGPTMSVDTWYVFAWTKNGTTINFYHATSGSTTLTSAGSMTGTTLTPTQVRMLESPWTGEWFDGDIFGVRIWSGAVLSQSELEAEMVQARANRTSNLWFEGFFFGASDLTDYSGNGRNFTGGGSLTTEEPPSGIPLFAAGGSISANVPATASQTGALTGTGALAASVASTSGQTAALSGSGALAASVASTSGQTAVLTGTGALASTVSSVTGQTGSLSGSGALSASVPATAGQTASLLASGALLASLSALAGGTASLTGRGALAASLAATGGSTASLVGTGALNAVLAALANAVGTMPGTADIAATVAASTSQTGLLSALGALAASVGAISGGTYGLTGTGALSANVGSQSGHTANLTSLSSGNMSATASGVSGLSGTLLALGALSASSAANTNTVADLGYVALAGSPGIIGASEFLSGLVDIWIGSSSETEAMERMSSYCNVVEFINGIASANEFGPTSVCEEYVEGVAS